MLEVAGKGNVRAGVSGADRRSAEGVPGFDDCESMVSGQGMRVLPQAVWRTALGRPPAGAGGRRTQDGAMERNSRGEVARNDANASAGLLGLPHCGNFPTRASGFGGGPRAKSAAHERL